MTKDMIEEITPYLEMAKIYERRHNEMPKSAARWDLAARDARAMVAFILRKVETS